MRFGKHKCNCNAIILMRKKKVAVADTSIFNLQRSIAQMEEEQRQRMDTLSNLEKDKKEKEADLNEKKNTLEELKKTQRIH